MDAGWAAVAGAVVGLVGSPLTLYLTRRLDRTDQRRDRAEQLREQQRGAFKEFAAVLGVLQAHRLPSPERSEVTRRLFDALTALDLVLDGEEGALMVQAARNAVFAVISNVGPEQAALDRGTRAAGVWLEQAAEWRRGRASATAVLAAVSAETGPPAPPAH